jgi:tRNA A37 threonylcarbamoyladenosine modification protein TsaB
VSRIQINRQVALALGVRGAGVSTLDALGAGGGPEALPVIDARRGEVFVPGPAAVSPGDLDPGGRLCIGDGAVRYRDVLESRGAVIPPDDDPRHVPRASLHARLLGRLGPVDEIVPLYVRDPDASRWRP